MKDPECIESQLEALNCMRRILAIETKVGRIEEDLKIWRLEQREFVVEQKETLSIYLASQAEMSKKLDEILIKVQANTKVTGPISKVLDKAKTKSLWIVIGLALTGLVSGIVYAFGGDPEPIKAFFKDSFERWL